MRNSSDIERDIELTRVRLDKTLEQIQARTSFASLADEALGYISSNRRARAFGQRLLTAAEATPLPIAIATIGVGLILRQLIARDLPPARSPSVRPHTNGTSRARAQAYGHDAPPQADTIRRPKEVFEAEQPYADIR